MTEEKRTDVPGEEKTIDEPVTGADSAPQAGVEREDAQSSPPVRQPLRRTGMWSDGSPDVSGYGGIVREIPAPTGEPLPEGGWQARIVGRLAEGADGAIERVLWDRGELTIYIYRDRIPQVMQLLRDDPQLRFEGCQSVSGVHYPHDVGHELHVVYHLNSYTHNTRLRIETDCPDGDSHVPSVVAIYPAADWHERETWDMFGVVFDGHPHLTRILMPDDWQGHPQRKDYPLGGVPIEYKGAVVPPPDQRRNYR